MANTKDVLQRTFGWQCREFLRYSIAYYSGTGFSFVAALYADLLSQCDKSIEALQWGLDNPLQSAASGGMTAMQISQEMKRIVDMRKCVIHEVYRRFKLEDTLGDYQAAILYWAKNGLTLSQFLAKQGDHHDQNNSSSPGAAAGYGSAFEGYHSGLDFEIQSKGDADRSLESAVSRLQQRFH